MKKYLTLLTFIFILKATATFAQQVRAPRPGPVGSWRMIGTTEARFTIDHDAIFVTGADNFRRLKFKVFDAPLKLLRLRVTYDNGVPDEIPTAYNIPQGGESRIIDLRGAGQRSLRKVEFWYDTRGVGRGTAKVQLWGIK